MRSPSTPISFAIAPVHPEPAKSTTVSSSPPTRLVDDRPGLLAQPGGLQPGAAGLGVRVGVAGQHLVADEVLEEAQRPPGGRVVGVGDPPGAVRRLHDVVLADHRLADQAQQRLLLGGHLLAGRGLGRARLRHAPSLGPRGGVGTHERRAGSSAPGPPSCCVVVDQRTSTFTVCTPVTTLACGALVARTTLWHWPSRGPRLTDSWSLRICLREHLPDRGDRVGAVTVVEVGERLVLEHVPAAAAGDVQAAHRALRPGRDGQRERDRPRGAPVGDGGAHAQRRAGRGQHRGALADGGPPAAHALLEALRARRWSCPW